MSLMRILDGIRSNTRINDGKIFTNLVSTKGLLNIETSFNVQKLLSATINYKATFQKKYIYMVIDVMISLN